jgi:hypothetical protein
MPSPPETGAGRAADGAPLLSLPGAVLALALAVVLCWPVWLTGAAYTFPDTTVYLDTGEGIWQMLGQVDAASGLAQGAAGAPADGGARPDPAEGAKYARSLTYSAAAYALWAWIGPWAVPVAQAWVVVMACFALIAPEALSRRTWLVLGAAWLAVLTPLPFFAVFLIPDLVTAVPILFGACLVWRWDALGPGQKAFATALAALAATSHYGTMPLALGCVAVALALRLLGGLRLPAGALAAALTVAVAGPATNLGASGATTGAASAVPFRLPILLARSVEDGPALWWLREHCPDGAPATCALLGEEIPAHVGLFLWTRDGISGATQAEMDAVRAEEPAILLGAFLDYPGAQTASLLGNAALQTVRVGLRELETSDGLDARFRPRDGPAADRGRALKRSFDPIVTWGAWTAVAAAAAVLAATRPSGPALLALGAVLAGLAGNALIFGGLSAPVERYQARVIWVLPFACLAVAAASPWRRLGPVPARGGGAS